MQQFKVGDSVLILPRFAHLYPANSAVVRHVQVNHARSAFTAYTIEFPDRSVETLFEFQLIDDVPGYTTVFAALTFDNLHAVAAGVRGNPPDRRIVLQTTDFNIDVRVEIVKSELSIIGELLERQTNELLKHVDVTILKEGRPVASTISDNTGVFTFRSIRRTSLMSFVVVMPKRKLRIVAPLSV